MMESHSMRRRQTVLGEQLTKASNASSSSQFLGVPGNSSGSTLNVPTHGNSGSSSSGPSISTARHMRSFSRISSRGGIHGAGFSVANGSGPSLVVPSNNGNVYGNDELGNDTASVISGIGLAGDDELDATLAQEHVDPVAYLSRTLAGTDADGLLRFGEKLRAQAQKAHEADQRKLQHSHKALSTVASNIAKLAPAVAELHRQVNDLSLVSDAMRQDAFASQAASAKAGSAGQGMGNSQFDSDETRKRASVASFYGSNTVDNAGLAENDATSLGLPTMPFDRRQSMLVLNPAWTNGLNDLYKRVDGAQRVLPPAPGRHLVHEEPNWSELNLVTQKPVRPVLIVILNDFLLLAAPKHGRFAHTCHLALEETLECQMDERNRVLRVGKNATQIGLLAPSLARLRYVYSEICKHVELASSRRRATRGNSLRRQDKNAGSAGQGDNSTNSGVGLGGPRSNHNSTGPLLGNFSSRTGRNKSISHNRKISQSSLASIPEFTVEERREAARIIADIDRFIAHRKWENATSSCTEHEEETLVGPLVAERRAKLVELMLEELKDRRLALTRADKSSVVQQLTKLGHAHDAKHALLNTAAADIQHQAREVHFMGDVVNYISQMAAIYFQTIISTVQVYKKSFPRKEDSSFVVTWVKSQVDLYAAIFNRQLFRIAPEFRAYQRCRDVSRLESSQLRELNMDMEFMLRYAWEA